MNPFDGKKRTVPRPYLSGRRKEVLEKVNNNWELDSNDKVVLERYKKRIDQYDKQENFEDSFKDVSRAEGRGMLDFDFGGQAYYNAIKCLILAESGAGKSTLMCNLLFEIPLSFESIVLFCPESTYLNECYQSLKHVCENVGLKLFWIDSSLKECPEWSEEPEINENGSAQQIYQNTFGSIWIFDDIYNSHKRNTWIQQLYSEAFIRYRHMKISTYILLQGMSYLDSELVNNYSHIFLSSGFLSKPDIWAKTHSQEPENLEEMKQILETSPSPKHEFFYFKMGDTTLKHYVPLKFQSKHQVYNKMRFKVPKPLRPKKKQGGASISQVKEKILKESFKDINPNAESSTPVLPEPAKPITQGEMQNTIEQVQRPRGRKVKRGRFTFYY